MYRLDTEEVSEFLQDNNVRVDTYFPKLHLLVLVTKTHLSNNSLRHKVLCSWSYAFLHSSVLHDMGLAPRNQEDSKSQADTLHLKMCVNNR